MKLELNDVLNAIRLGDFDDNLDALDDAITDRQHRHSRVTFATAKIGGTGTLKDLRPKYLIGAPVTVVGRAQTRLIVRIDPQWLAIHGTGKYQGDVKVTPAMIDLD